MRLLILLCFFVFSSCEVETQIVVCRKNINMEKIRECASSQIPSNARIVSIKKTDDSSIYVVRYVR